MTQADHPTSVSLLDRLAEALTSQQTGTFFVATNDNASCRFALDNGKITHFAYKRLHGLEALHEFATILSGRWSFSEGISCPFRPHDSVEHMQAVELLGVKPPSAADITPVTPTVTAISAPIPAASITSEATVPSVTEAPTKPAKSRLNMFYRGGFSAATVEPTPVAEATTPAPAATPTGMKNRFYRGGFAH